MKLLNEQTIIKHRSYDEFELNQKVIELIIGETVEILVNGSSVMIYTAKYSDAHINIIVQDKGTKKIQ